MISISEGFDLIGAAKSINLYFVYIQMVSPKKYVITILLCLATLVPVHAKLEVTNLAQLNPALVDEDLKNIPYSIANFGFAPFGKTLVAHLQEAPGLSNQCAANASETPHSSIQNSFLLIPRGECPFVTKAIHAQELGAKMAIIMDNQDHQGGIIMKDNGYGYKVKIPSIFINYKMGQKLKTLLNQTSNNVNLRISFENIKTEKADVLVYMQSLNRLSYYFIQQFRPYYNLIKDHITFNIAYDVINCTMCSSDDCYYNGQYCSVSYEHGFSASGKLLLDQQLREQIMFEKHTEEWWPYLDCVNNQCSKISEVKECSDRCLGLSMFTVKPDTLAAELAQSFDYNNDNSILRRSLESLRNSGVQSFPSVSINSIKIKGSVSAEFVFDDICNSLLKPPKQCSQYIVEKEFHVEINNTYWITIVLVLILSAVLFVGLFIFCRRRMRSNMTAEMQGRVDDMVSKYIEFYSERNNNRAA